MNSSSLTITPGWCKSSDSSLIRPRIHTICASDTPTQRSQALALLKPERMRRAIAATFARRNTQVPSATPDGLSDAFADDPGKQRQWEAFARNLSESVNI